MTREPKRFIEPNSGLRLYPIPHPHGRDLVCVPGVTSVLGTMAEKEDQEVIERWREKSEALGRDTKAGANRGTRVHRVLEEQIMGLAAQFPPPELEVPLAKPGDIAYWAKELEAAAGGEGSPLRGELLQLAEQLGHGEVMDCVWRTQQCPVQWQPRLAAVLDAAFHSGMEQRMALFDELLWNERPLVSGWDHLWSAPPGHPDRLARVWSWRWGYAGTPDLLGRIRRKMILGDFKTSTQPYYRCSGTRVPQHKMTGYKKYKKTVRQLCAYKLAIKEVMDIDVDGLMIIVGLPGVGQSQQFFITGSELEVETEAFKQLSLTFWRGESARRLLESVAAADHRYQAA